MAKRRTKAELAAFFGKTVPDVIGPGLRAVFCGINPSLSSAADKVHFATPGNRFWPSLHKGGLTPRLLHPSENEALLGYGLGVTNLVARATASAAELSDEEYPEGVQILREKCETFRPKAVAIVGMGAYRVGFDDRKATLGPQEVRLGTTRVYVLPNPSGLNAHYSPAKLGALFGAFREWLEAL